MKTAEIHKELSSTPDTQHDLNGSAKKSVVYALYIMRNNFKDNFIIFI